VVNVSTGELAFHIRDDGPGHRRQHRRPRSSPQGLTTVSRSWLTVGGIQRSARRLPGAEGGASGAEKRRRLLIRRVAEAWRCGWMPDRPWSRGTFGSAACFIPRDGRGRIATMNSLSPAAKHADPWVTIPCRVGCPKAVKHRRPTTES
jgi:hypothetical protein